MTKEEIIKFIISAVLSGVFLNGIATHILYSRKLKKEQKARSQNVIWDKIAEALENIRNIELRCRVIEIYQIEDRLKDEEYIQAFVNEAIYPEVMNDSETFIGFYESVNQSRSKWGKYLDPKVGAYLFYMQNYCVQLIDFINKNNLSNNYPVAGTVFIFDLQKWQKEYEKLLVRRINKPKHKVYVEDGIRWERAKKRVLKKLWKTSMLYNLISGVDNPKIALVKAILFGADDMEKVLKDSEEYSKKHWIKRKLHRL